MQTIKSECAQSSPHNNQRTIEWLRVEFIPDVNIFYCYYGLINVAINIVYPSGSITLADVSTTDTHRILFANSLTRLLFQSTISIRFPFDEAYIDTL